MINRGYMLPSNTDEWETPQDLFALLNQSFEFDLDVCASRENAKCPDYFDKATDGLVQNWGNHTCWMNPPYGRCLSKWIKKAYESWRDNGATVVCLVPSRTGTRWFHEYCLPYAEIRFLKGRLKFGKSTGNAPFDSMLVIFRHNRK